ncbi:hypothetical protein EV1_003301 [Malus domestica]
MVIQESLTKEENAKLQLQELEALDERRLEAQQHLECYKQIYPKSSTRRSTQGLFKLEILSRHNESLSSQLTKQKASSHQSGITNGLHQRRLLNHDGRWLEDRPHQQQILEVLLPLNQTSNAPRLHEPKLHMATMLLIHTSLKCDT